MLITLAELAVAAPGAVARIGHPTEQTAGRRVGHSRIEGADAIPQLVQSGLVVVADAVFQGQPARRLPAILREQPPGDLQELGILRSGNGGAGHRTKQEAGIGESYRTAAETRIGRERCLLAAEV